MVAHAVYREDMASLAGTTSEDSPGSSVAIAGHAAGRMAAEGAAGSSGRPAAVVVAKSATHRGVVVAITRHRTVAVVHRRIVIVVVVAVAIAVPVAVAIAVPVAVAVVVPVAVAVVVPVSVVMVIVVVVVVDIIIVVVVAMSHRRIVSMSFGRIGSVEVVSGIVACAPAAMATLEGHEHCGTVEEHPSDTVAGVDGEGPATGAPDDGTVEPLTGHEAVVLPGAEHITQVAVANFPPKTEHVGAGIYVEQVIEIDLIHCLILCCCQSELVGHLVRKIKGLVSCGVVRHCCGGDGYRHHHHQGHHLFHVFYVLMVELFFPFLDGKGKAKNKAMKRILPKLKGWFPSI